MASTDVRASLVHPQSPLRAAAAGLGLRRALLQDLRDAPAGDFDFLECAPENWIHVGGPAGDALAELAQHQPMNAASGSIHAAAWADASGRIGWVREDVGRHNALDKLIGALHHNEHAIEGGLLVISSRASYEMVSKAVRAGASVLAAVSAPTALAIDLARSAGLCLVGFARESGFNVYTHPERLQAHDGHAR